MRIGLTATGTTVDQLIKQTDRAEAEGFTSLWYTGAVEGDPLVPMALAGRATSRIELGTAVLPTYPCHPALQAARAAAVASAIGTPGRLTVGVGPSHRRSIEGMLGLSYDTPGQHTEEYVQILAALLRGEQVKFSGEEFCVNAGPLDVPEGAGVPVLVGALAPRLLRVAGRYAAGTVLWMANARAIEEHVAPRIRKAAADAGRPAPRIVAGLPIAVHDDVDEGRAIAGKQFALYCTLPSYQRILAWGGAAGPAEVAIVGEEAGVTRQIQALFEAGATDVWAAPFAVGSDRLVSGIRTRALLRALANS